MSSWQRLSDLAFHPQVLYGIMIVNMVYLGFILIIKTKDRVSIKLFLNGVFIFLAAFILWNIGSSKQEQISYILARASVNFPLLSLCQKLRLALVIVSYNPHPH